MTPDENARDTVTAGHRSADDPHDRVPIRVSIPRELPARLRHVHFTGTPGRGKAVPLQLLIAQASAGDASRGLNGSEPSDSVGLGNLNGITGLDA